MKKVNIAKLRANLSPLLEYVQNGGEIQVEKRNLSIARIIPTRGPTENKTKLGVGQGSVKFLGNITDPVMDDDWDMHQNKP